MLPLTMQGLRGSTCVENSASWMCLYRRVCAKLAGLLVNISRMLLLDLLCKDCVVIPVYSVLHLVHAITYMAFFVLQLIVILILRLW